MAIDMNTLIVKTSDDDSGNTFIIVDSTARADINTLKSAVTNLQNTQITSESLKSEVAAQLEESEDDIVQKVLSAIGETGVIGTIDENNIITISSSLEDGTYTLKYENEDGTTTTIGTFVVDSNSSSGDDSGGSGETTNDKNLVPKSVALDSTNIYNGVGYKDGYRSNSSGNNLGETKMDGRSITGLMRANAGDLIYAKNIGWVNDNSSSNYITFYDSTKTLIQAVQESQFRTACSGNLNSAGDIVAYKIPKDDKGNWGISLANTYYFRISGAAPGSNFIVQVNEEIV